MEITIRESCIRCGHCVKVCPSKIFRQAAATEPVEVCHPDNCIVCGHCVAVCPTDSVSHAEFPASKVHRIDKAALPTPEQVELLIASRRSNRAMTDRPVPQEYLDRIIAAANRAPTATNAQNLGYTLVTDPRLLRGITEITFAVFGKIIRKAENPFVKPILKRIIPDAYRYIPVFRSMRREYDEKGVNRILRGGTAVLVIHAPKSSRYGSNDANLAYQNASLMAESLGVSQVYMGFVMSAMLQDRGNALQKMLGLAPDRRIGAIMALGMPQFRYPNYVDRKEAEVEKV